MTTFVKKYNFAKFINFITSIDGDFNNASIEYITDAIYDDTCDNNEDELFNSDKSDIMDVLNIIKVAMTKKRAKNRQSAKARRASSSSSSPRSRASETARGGSFQYRAASQNDHPLFHCPDEECSCCRNRQQKRALYGIFHQVR